MHNGRPRSTLVRYCYRSIWKLLAWKVRNSTGLRIISRSDGATDKIIIRYDNQIYSDGATVRVTAPPFASPAPSGPPTRATAAHAVPRGKPSAQSRNPARCLSRPPPLGRARPPCEGESPCCYSSPWPELLLLWLCRLAGLPTAGAP